MSRSQGNAASGTRGNAASGTREDELNLTSYGRRFLTLARHSEYRDDSPTVAALLS